MGDMCLACSGAFEHGDELSGQVKVCLGFVGRDGSDGVGFEEEDGGIDFVASSLVFV